MKITSNCFTLLRRINDSFSNRESIIYNLDSGFRLLDSGWPNADDLIFDLFFFNLDVSHPSWARGGTRDSRISQLRRDRARTPRRTSDDRSVKPDLLGW